MPEHISTARLPRDLMILSGAFFLIFMSGGAQQQFLIPYLKSTTTWGTMKYSFVLAMVYISFMVWRILVGYSIRVLGDYRSIVLGSLTYTGFVAAVLFARSFALILCMAMLWGWGAASMWIVSSSQILNVTERTRYGTASGVFYFWTHVGFTLGVLILGVTQNRWGGESLYRLALMIVLAGNGIMLFVPRRSVERGARPVGEILRMMRTPKVQIVGFLQFCSALSFGLVLGVFADFISEEYGSPYLLLTVFFPLARAVLSLAGGMVSDRLGRGRALFVGFFISGVGVLISAGWSSPIAVALSVLTLGIQSGMVPPVSMALIGDSVEPERRHLAFGAIFVWRDFGVALAILGGQYIRLQLGGFGASFLLFGLLFLICAFLGLRLTKREREQF